MDSDTYMDHDINHLIDDFIVNFSDFCNKDFILKVLDSQAENDLSFISSLCDIRNLDYSDCAFRYLEGIGDLIVSR